MPEVRERQGTRERVERRRSHSRAPERQRESDAPEQAQAPPEEAPDETAQPPEETEQKQSWLSRMGLPVFGWSLVLLVLAGYFVWLASQMGTAAVTGIGPLVAVFAAAALGVLLAGAALVLAKRVREK